MPAGSAAASVLRSQMVALPPTGAAAQGQSRHEGRGCADAAQGAGGIYHNAGGRHALCEVIHHLVILGMHGEGVACALVVKNGRRPSRIRPCNPVPV